MSSARIKLILICLFGVVVCLLGFAAWQISMLRTQLNDFSQQNQELTTQLTDQKQQAKKYEGEFRRLQYETALSEIKTAYQARESTEQGTRKSPPQSTSHSFAHGWYIALPKTNPSWSCNFDALAVYEKRAQFNYLTTGQFNCEIDSHCIAASWPAATNCESDQQAVLQSYTLAMPMSLSTDWVTSQTKDTVLKLDALQTKPFPHLITTNGDNHYQVEFFSPQSIGTVDLSEGYGSIEQLADHPNTELSPFTIYRRYRLTFSTKEPLDEEKQHEFVSRLLETFRFL